MWLMNGNDLPRKSNIDCEETHLWDPGCDDWELFKVNKDNPNMNKKYLDPSNPITYCLNDHGYRTKNFDQFEENNFMLVLGCSHTYGIGLHYEDVWCNQLGSMINLDVMNLANSGFGADWVFTASATYAANDKYPKPSIVVIQWPQCFRKYFSYYLDEGDTRIILDPKNPQFERVNEEVNLIKQFDYKWYFNRFIVDHAEKIRINHYNFLAVQKFWKSWGVPVYNWSFQNDYLTGDEYHPMITEVETVDTGRARDMAHDGPDIHNQVANKIKDGVLKCLNG